MAAPPDSGAPSPVAESRWRTLVGPASLALVLLATYWEVVLGGQSFALRDHLMVTQPGRSFIRGSLLAGRLPQWWDGVGLGVPGNQRDVRAAEHRCDASVPQLL